jgi:cold shock protein
MLKGTIKFFNDVKGFGFISPDGGAKDVFFHFTAMSEGNEVTKNDKGKNVTYELKDGKNGPEADKVVIL